MPFIRFHNTLSLSLAARFSSLILQVKCLYNSSLSLSLSLSILLLLTAYFSHPIIKCMQWIKYILFLYFLLVHFVLAYSSNIIITASLSIMDKRNCKIQNRSHQSRRETENPSFSSTLLDQIYRSIDGEDELVLYTETMRKKKQYSTTTTSMLKNEQDLANFRRRMEKKKVINSSSDKFILHNKSADCRRKSLENNAGHDISSMLLNSSWSSADSSIRTCSFSAQQPAGSFQNHEKILVSEQKLKHQGGGTGGFVKTKSKALKIYRELKKVKQPISPGGRLASFLSSIFSSAGDAKKAKISLSEEEERIMERESKSAHASSCSSASSFSRSCLSKTPSSNGTKRSVRFYPVTTHVIVEADCRQPSAGGHKYNLQRNETSNFVGEELRFHIREKNRRVEEAARDLLKNYHKKVERQMDDDQDDDDDDASYASSDLFELDNLNNSAIERYREELPVYETTYFDTNRAIANGLIP